MMSVSRIPRCARSIPEATTDAGLGICRPVRDIAHQTPMPRNTVAMFSVRMAGGRRRFVDSLRDGFTTVAFGSADTGSSSGVEESFGGDAEVAVGGRAGVGGPQGGDGRARLPHPPR